MHLTINTKRILIAILLLTTYLTPIYATGEAGGVVSIITLNSPWHTPISSELNIELAREAPDCTLQVNNLTMSNSGGSRIWREEMEEIVADLHTMDSLRMVVLVGDEVWITFNEVDRGRLSNTPLLLCGVKRMTAPYSALLDLKQLSFEELQPTERILARYPHSRAVFEPVVEYLLENIQMIEQQLPETTDVGVITDYHYYGVYTRLIAQQLFERSFPHLTPHYFDGCTMNTNELNQAIAELPEKTALLFSSWTPRNREMLLPVEQEENGGGMYERPLFALRNNTQVLRHSVGGYYTDFSTLAFACGKVFAQMLRGESSERSTVVADAYWHLNDQTIKKWGFNKNLFKGKVVYSSLQPSLYSRFVKEILLFMLLLFLALCFFVYRNRLHRRYAKRMEQQNEALKLAAAETAAANRHRTNFLEHLTHEVKTPLNALMGFSELINDEGVELEEQQLYSKLLHDNARGLNTLFAKVTELSHIESGVIEFDRNPVELSTLLLLSAQERDEAAVKVEATLPFNHITLIGDEVRLLQVMNQLIDNAINHTTNGCVQIGCRADATHLTFYVEDSGRGIAEEHHSRIFERFYKVDDEVKGAGLGLAAAKLLVERMGGHIWVESTLGEGSTFYFTHPI